MDNDNNNLHYLIFLVKRAIAYFSINKDNPIFTRELKKKERSLYLLHILLNSYYDYSNNQTFLLDRNAFVRVDGTIEKKADTPPINQIEDKKNDNNDEQLISYSFSKWWKYVINKI